MSKAMTATSTQPRKVMPVDRFYGFDARVLPPGYEGYPPEC
jgi:hypothetical protein